MSTITDIKCVLSQKAFDVFCEKFHIPKEIHPVMANRGDTMHERPGGKIGLYTRLFDFTNFRLPLFTFLVNIPANTLWMRKLIPYFLIRMERDDELRLLEITVDRTVPLLLVTPDRGESELDASVDKLFDEGGSGTQTEQGDSAGGGGGQAGGGGLCGSGEGGGGDGARGGGLCGSGGGGGANGGAQMTCGGEICGGAVLQKSPRRETTNLSFSIRILTKAKNNINNPRRHVAGETACLSFSANWRAKEAGLRLARVINNRDKEMVQMLQAMEWEVEERANEKMLFIEKLKGNV
nr:hypothetical protein [Tanacetum cinerariifolium]